MKTLFPDGSSRRKSAHASHDLSGLTSAASHERGIALVITLILLSVTLIMAVAFLAVARRERNAVTTTTDTTTARLATDAALSAAEAQIAQNIFSGNPYNFGLLVSTNLIADPTVPYDPTAPAWDTNALPRPPVFVLTNGNFDFRFYLDLNRNGKFDSNGVVTVVDSTGANTTNTMFVVGDPEWIGVLERPDANPANNNKFPSRYAFIALPVGNGLDVNYTHNQAATRTVDPSYTTFASDGFLRNQGVGSWELNLAAFLADLNTNQWNNPSAPFVYNEPSGSANSGNAFQDALSLLSYRYNYNYGTLASANNYFTSTNVGNYPYNIDLFSDGPLQTTVDFSATPPGDNLNLSWAGADNPNRFFALPSDLFDPTKSSIPFTNRLTVAGAGVATYDQYTFYRLLSQLGTDSTADDGRMNLNFDNLDAGGNVVPGAETNLIAWTSLRFFTNAANRLMTNATTTWLAANSANYTATFQTNAPFGIANIPVYVNGQFVYTPAVNRLLQLAANMYDSSTGSQYPSVFRPTFNVVNQNVYINGYEQVASVSGTADLQLATPTDVTALAPGTYTTNVYGVPWIIGAKKGLPNFNQFYLLDAAQVTRKLQITKPYFGAPLDLYQTNQMYIFSVNNLLGCSVWNSYTSAYTGTIDIVARDYISEVLTNDDPGFIGPSFTSYFVSNQITLANWPGTTWSDSTSTNKNPKEAYLDHNSSFFPLFNKSLSLLPSAIYRFAGFNGAANPYFDANIGGVYQTAFNTSGNPLLGLTPPLPHFGLLTTNRLQVFILNNGHVIDYVNFAGPECALDVSGELADPKGVLNANQIFFWNTNYATNSTTPQGVVDQITYSQAYPPSPSYPWAPPSSPAPGLPNTVEAEAAYFRGFFTNTGVFYHTTNGVTVTVVGGGGGSGSTLGSGSGKSGGGSLSGNGSSGGGGGGGTIVTTPPWGTNNSPNPQQVPYTPIRLVFTNISWQANDPLVHYLASDLNYNSLLNTRSPSDNPDTELATFFVAPPNNASLTNLSARYSPWGRSYPYVNANNAVPADWSVPMKDPLVWRSDDWDFPAAKYPSVGWLGRVHRGTPWQTVYLKASDILAANNGPSSWSQWTGDANAFDAANAAPLADEALFDLFTTAPDVNATHGTLSINQPGLAAWSAVFSGVLALTNTAVSTNAGYFAASVGSTVIAPAGSDGMNSALGTLVNGINFLRTSYTNADGVGGAFEHIGSLLRSPTLTELSPFLNTSGSQTNYGISDALYEWLPQQTFGLLRVTTTPRYVVYCFGQALRPAVNGIVTSPGNFGLVTNYQIVAESVARAVVRLDKNVTTNAVGVPTGTNYTPVVESYNLLPPN